MSRTSRRMVGVGITLVATVGLAVAASGVTSAYFSDTKNGTVTGTVGYVRIATSGGTGTDHLNLQFSNLMPGEPQTVSFTYQNVGTGPQDIYLTFPVGSALHALNNLGHFGYIKIVDSSAGNLFESSNLQDGRTIPPTQANPNPNSCGSFSTAGCWPVPSQIKLRTALAPNDSGTVSITFMYPDLPNSLNSQGAQGLWNVYPPLPPGGQAFGDDLTPSGNGLPYAVVGTQVGRTP